MLVVHLQLKRGVKQQVLELVEVARGLRQGIEGLVDALLERPVARRGKPHEAPLRVARLRLETQVDVVVAAVYQARVEGREAAVVGHADLALLV